MPLDSQVTMRGRRRCESARSARCAVQRVRAGERDVSAILRGQVWWTDLGEPRGSEPGYRHPVLVIQRDEVNRSRLGTVVVCDLTSNTRLASAPGNTLLRRRLTGLPRDSVANASQLLTLNRDELVAKVGAVPPLLMDRVDSGLRWFLRLDAPTDR